MEVTNFSLDKQLVFLQSLEDLPHMHNVLLGVLGKNKDVVQINKNRGIQKISQDVIHQGLKNCWSVSKAKGHHQIFKVSKRGVKGSFPGGKRCAGQV